MNIRQAVILAGGRGERMRPFTDTMPKPMVSVRGKPFLEHLVELLKEQGIREIVMLLGYLPDKITEHFGDGSRWGIHITYAIGDVLDETGSRVRNAKELLAPKFLLMYADNYWPLNMKKMEALYERKKILATTTVYSNKDGGGEYGPENNVFVDEKGMVRLYDKTRKDKRLNGVDIGFFLLERKVLDLMPEHNFSFEQVILPALIQRNELAAFRTDHPYYPITSPDRLPKAEAFLTPKKVVFLDRDGVISRSMPPHAYVKKWQEFKFLPGAIEGLSLLTESGYQIFIVTNQRGIARGLMTERDLAGIHENMIRELKQQGVRIDGIYHCPHEINAGCECRKPKPGLLYRAAREHYLDLTKSIFIGDTEGDCKAAETAGCRPIIMPTDGSLFEIVRSLP